MRKDETLSVAVPQADQETGRPGLERALTVMSGELQALAAAPIVGQMETWKARAIAYVFSNDALQEVASHRRGIFSIYQALAKAAQMGLQVGGHFPHVYLVPFAPEKNAPKIAQPVVTAEGYIFATKHGPQPVVKDVSYAVVREGDTITIDQAAGEVRHTVNPLVDRGKPLGVWVRVVPLHSRPSVIWYGYADLIAVRNARSISWKYAADRSPWKTDEEAMLMKTAVKKALRPYAAEAEGLSMLYSEDDGGAMPTGLPAGPDPEPRDVTDRAGAVLTAALAGMGDPEPDPEPQPEPDTEPEPTADPDPKQEGADGDLF